MSRTSASDLPLTRACAVMRAASDGESTVVPWYEESIEWGAKVGLQIGVGTNGVRLKRKVLERILPHIAYLRFNFSAGDRDRYSEIMGLKGRDYDQVIQNVKDAIEIKRRDNLKLNINLQMVTMPEFHDQILPLGPLRFDAFLPGAGAGPGDQPRGGQGRHR
jgi:MoaA/NifB/PqqE/SkfB family radical SAM enzyme